MRTRLPAVSLSAVCLLLCSPFPARSEPAVLQLAHKFTAPASLVTGRSYRFTFRLCDAAAVGAGNVVWEESALHKVPAGRAIAHQLGSVIPFSNDVTGALPLPPVDFSQQLWVEVRRGTALVGRGRVRLGPVVPYALWSAGAAAGSVTTLAIADGTVRDQDIAPDAAIADAKLATIATPGKVADSALSGNVMLLDGAQTVTGPKTFAPGSGAPFAIDAASRAMVANLDADGALRLLHCTEAHCQTDVPDHRIDYHDLGPGGENNALTIGPDGFPLISDSGVTVFHCGNVDCSDHGSPSEVAPHAANAPTSIAVGGDGLPVVAYSAPDPRLLHCATADCSLLASSPRSLEAVRAVSSSLAIGANGLPVVAYCDDQDNLKVASCGDATCTAGTVIETVATTPAGCTYTALTIGRKTRCPCHNCGRMPATPR